MTFRSVSDDGRQRIHPDPTVWFQIRSVGPSAYADDLASDLPAGGRDGLIRQALVDPPP